MNWTKRRSIALVLLVTWVLYGAYLYPLPTARIAISAQELHTEHLTWIEEKDRQEFKREYAAMRDLLWREWLINLALVGAGLAVGITVLRGVRHWRGLAIMCSVVFLLDWFVRYDNRGDAGPLQAYLAHVSLLPHVGWVAGFGTLVIDGFLPLLQLAIIGILSADWIRLRRTAT